MFERVDFREDGKKWGKKLFGGCLVGRERGKERVGGEGVWFGLTKTRTEYECLLISNKNMHIGKILFHILESWCMLALRAQYV